MCVNKHFTHLGSAYLKSKRCYNVIPSVHYFYVKANMLADFQIWISVPLIVLNAFSEGVKIL